MNSVNKFEISESASSLLCTIPQAVKLGKTYREKISSKKAAMQKYKEDKRREKKGHKSMKSNKRTVEVKDVTDAEPFHPAIRDNRSIKEFQYLNKIDEGTYGIVFRARDKVTGDTVALKRLKALNQNEGFSIAARRELTTLLKIQHPNIVAGREIVVGSGSNEVFVAMEYVPHQLKNFMDTMRMNHLMFSPAHVKCLMTQLLNAVLHLHDKGILHRDLKTNNLLLSQDGILKVADLGSAREYESIPQQYTPGKVTRWYRAPELLLLSREYSTPVDMWSVGCIFAELIMLQPLFPGTTEIDQLDKIFKELGTPSETIWPGYNALPIVKHVIFDSYAPGGLRKKINRRQLTDCGFSFLQGLLIYNPVKRLTAASAIEHAYFKEEPVAIKPDRFLISM
ncbi:hypothetical protein HW555_001256 [Spodoptera exigua]|uniref:Protein kinase domain-containing protein n=1 Tax=Spodoptera exigua TaxID=7107 RepID=A0A835GQG4_SPOEX|nr:hypothetical protein HW555_001256 [Spodoptera exigua]